ncbi:MAG: hypothetical protein QOG72_1715 [Sphingomonadales bacterium]|nr:hypothetical protein [Sphingomonadales bacterium]
MQASTGERSNALISGPCNCCSSPVQVEEATDCYLSKILRERYELRAGLIADNYLSSPGSRLSQARAGRSDGGLMVLETWERRLDQNPGPASRALVAGSTSTGSLPTLQSRSGRGRRRAKLLALSSLRLAPGAGREPGVAAGPCPAPRLAGLSYGRELHVPAGSAGQVGDGRRGCRVPFRAGLFSGSRGGGRQAWRGGSPDASSRRRASRDPE